MRICRTCKGYGYYWKSYGSRDTQSKRVPCTDCAGTGKVAANDWERGFLPADVPESLKRIDDAFDLEDLTCEAHAGTKWPHGDCAGPGIPRKKE